jgi:hypothetical protein
MGIVARALDSEIQHRLAGVSLGPVRVVRLILFPKQKPPNPYELASQAVALRRRAQALLGQGARTPATGATMRSQPC